MARIKTFLANHPKFAANYNQLSGFDQNRWRNKFQQGGAQAVKPFTQRTLAAPRYQEQMQTPTPQAASTTSYPMQDPAMAGQGQVDTGYGTEVQQSQAPIDQPQQPIATGYTGTPEQFNGGNNPYANGVGQVQEPIPQLAPQPASQPAYQKFLQTHPRFAVNYNQLDPRAQNRWANNFQQGGGMGVRQFMQRRGQR